MIAKSKPAKQRTKRQLVQAAEQEPRKDDSTCITPDCMRKAVTRGVCSACYTSAVRYVRLGRTSWKRLEELGIVNRPHASGGRLVFGPMSLAIEKALGSLPKD